MVITSVCDTDNSSSILDGHPNGFSMKKILIISCSVGNGHVKAAEALQKTFNILYPDTHTEHADFLDFIGLASKKIFFETYDLIIKNIPTIYRLIYDITDNKTAPKIVDAVTLLQKKINTKKYKKFIINCNPDFIIFTHFTPANVFRSLKLSIPHASVVTDYIAHSLWQNGNDQKYFVAGKKTKKSLEDLGVKPKNIFISGIPVAPEFYEKYDKNNICETLGLNPDKKIVTIMPCGFGKINTIKVAKNILENDNYQVVALAGKNKKLLKKYHSIKNQNLTAVGWTDKAPEYLKIADIIISKPGGLTSTECLTLEKPLILINPIPGQEEHNVEYLMQNNLAIQLTDEDNIWETIEKSTQLNKTKQITFRDHFPAKTIMAEIKKTVPN